MGAADVDAWFGAKRHPRLEPRQAVREAILAADPRISETIKWSTPTFAYRGNIVSFNPQARAYVSSSSTEARRSRGEPDP